MALASVLLVLQTGPAYACSCRADVALDQRIAEGDAAFVGVLTGRDEVLPQGEIISSGRPTIAHFRVDQSVKGGIGAQVDARTAASGASCGLEVLVGERIGIILHRTDGGWTSSLCDQVEPAALLAPGGPDGPAPVPLPPAGSTFPSSNHAERNLLLAVGAFLVAVPAGVAIAGRARSVRDR